MSNHGTGLTIEKLLAARKVLCAGEQGPELYGVKLHPADLERLKADVSLGRPDYFSSVKILVDHRQPEGCPVSYWNRQQFEEAAREIRERR